MEVLDLEVCDFVQFRPGDAWTVTEYDCVEVRRDREWFKTHLATLEEFWQQVLRVRAHVLDERTVLENLAATVIQCAHRQFREQICRPATDRHKEATRNLKMAICKFRKARAPPTESLPPRKRRKVVEVTIEDENAYAIVD